MKPFTGKRCIKRTKLNRRVTSDGLVQTWQGRIFTRRYFRHLIACHAEVTARLKAEGRL